MEMVDQTKLGNMAQVYFDVAREAEHTIRRMDEKQGPFDAEIVPDCTPKWHAVRTAPNHERIAAAHLLQRRFGVYLPEFDYDPVLRVNLDKCRLLLPGYVLLFVWDVDRHVRRIRACTGVTDLLLESDRIATIPDSLIHRIQACENAYRKPLVMRIEDMVIKKKYRPRRRVKEVPVGESDIVGVHAYSAFDEERRLAAKEAIEDVRSAFHRAMSSPAGAA